MPPLTHLCVDRGQRVVERLNQLPILWGSFHCGRHARQAGCERHPGAAGDPRVLHDLRLGGAREMQAGKQSVHAGGREPQCAQPQPRAAPAGSRQARRQAGRALASAAVMR